MTTVLIDTAALERRLHAASGKMKRIARNAINDSARDLRRDTPGIIKRTIDRPTAFTASPSSTTITPASYSSMSATLRMAPIQSRYLSPAEFGLRSEKIHTPISRDAFDARGNLLAKFRWTPTAKAALLAQRQNAGTRRIGKYFFGRPKGKYRVPGLFERPATPGGKLRRITAVQKQRRYQPKFGIRKAWQQAGSSHLQRHLSTQARRPENRL